MRTHWLAATLISTSCVGLAQEPGDTTTERSTAVPAWDLAIIERTHCRPESDVCGSELLVEDKKKGRRLLASGLQGEFIPLLKARKIVACEYNAIMTTKNPLLISLNGATTSLPAHAGDLKECKTAGTGEQVLLVYISAEAGKPYSLVRVHDSSGALLVEKRLEAAGDVHFKVNGKSFREHIPAPEFPG